MSDRVRIYSAQHGAYWCPNGHGYTSNPEEAWITTSEEARKVTDHCGPEKMIELWPVAEGWKTRKELEAENARLRAALERNLQGFRNLLEVRRILGSDRYGALTREEVEQEIGLIEAALAGKEQA